jgi:hypothetical protein
LQYVAPSRVCAYCGAHGVAPFATDGRMALP